MTATTRFVALLLLATTIAFGVSCTKNYYTILPPEHAPRVLWVPDDYQTIQDAIWASEDGDTIMVRAGEYHEQLQFFDKNVSLVSESGPEETTIDGTGYYTAASITGGQDTTMLVRGFRFLNRSDVQSYCISLSGGASPKIFNNIFQMPDVPRGYGLIAGQSMAQIRNNLFISVYGSGDIASCWGDFTNNMILDATNGLRNAQNRDQPLIPDYNLFWNVSTPNAGFSQWGLFNIHDEEPAFLVDSYQLEAESPGVNQGREDLLDRDGTRSDIGVYGGPYAY